MIKFCWRSGSQIRIRIDMPGKTCLGGGMHCPSASSCCCCQSHDRPSRYHRSSIRDFGR